jgi:hypothetical protein
LRFFAAKLFYSVSWQDFTQEQNCRHITYPADLGAV